MPRVDVLHMHCFIVTVTCGSRATPPIHRTVVGTINIDYKVSSGPAVTFLEFTDDAWSSVTKPDGTFSADCVGINNAASIRTPLTSVSPIEIDVKESDRAHYWYFVLSAADCNAGPFSISYTLTVRQADGGQLSYDELGMPSIFGAFFFFMLVASAAHIYLHYIRRPRFGPLVVIVFTVAILSETLATMCLMTHWAVVSSDGVGAPWINVIGDLLLVTASAATWIVAGLAANGYGIVTYSLSERKAGLWRGAALLAFTVVIYLAGLGWYRTQRSPAATSSFGSTWVGVILLLLTLAFLGWCVGPDALSCHAVPSAARFAQCDCGRDPATAYTSLLPFTLQVHRHDPRAYHGRDTHGQAHAAVAAVSSPGCLPRTPTFRRVHWRRVPGVRAHARGDGIRPLLGHGCVRRVTSGNNLTRRSKYLDTCVRVAALVRSMHATWVVDAFTASMRCMRTSRSHLLDACLALESVPCDGCL